jgi:hypothetical protein
MMPLSSAFIFFEKAETQRHNAASAAHKGDTKIFSKADDVAK